MELTIHIKSIPHNEHRPEAGKTVGDWLWMTPTTLEIRVSEMQSRHMLAVGLHELIEAVLCQDRGIKGSEVDRFDLTFAGDGEPGDDPMAPYNCEHVTASICERTIAYSLGVDWNEYEKELDSL